MSNTGLIGWDTQLGAEKAPTSRGVGDLLIFRAAIAFVHEEDVYDRALQRLHNPGPSVPLDDVIADLDKPAARG